jgi:hypothetical protein
MSESVSRQLHSIVCIRQMSTTDSLAECLANKVKMRKMKKIPSAKNWKLIHQKKKNKVILEHWEPDSTGTSHGVGMKSGVKTELATFKKFENTVVEWIYNAECDSWFLRDDNGETIRASWSNAFQNARYGMLKTREEANAILRRI